MMPDLILDLTLLRQFQLPVELRKIIIETYFPFLINEKAPFLSTIHLRAYMNDHYRPTSQNYHFINHSDNQMQDGDSGIALCLQKKKGKIHATIGRGIYRVCSTSMRYVFYHKEELYYDDKIVELYCDFHAACVEQIIPKIIRFYRQWVMRVLNGVGYFNVRGLKRFHNFNLVH